MSRLVLVDDHLLVRDSLKAALEAHGHTVVGESDDPDDALAQLARLRPDILLLDLQLGARSGMTVLEQLGKRSPETRCIVLTMSAQPHLVTEALRLKAFGYLLKGSRVSELLTAIAQVAHGRHYLGDGVADLAAQALAAPAQAQETVDPLTLLSQREREVVRMVVQGLSSTAIGERLHLSPRTVDTYRSRLMSKLGVADVTALVRLGVKHGWVDASG